MPSASLCKQAPSTFNTKLITHVKSANEIIYIGHHVRVCVGVVASRLAVSERDMLYCLGNHAQHTIDMDGRLTIHIKACLLLKPFPLEIGCT